MLRSIRWDIRVPPNEKFFLARFDQPHGLLVVGSGSDSVFHRAFAGVPNEVIINEQLIPTGDRSDGAVEVSCS